MQCNTNRIASYLVISPKEVKIIPVTVATMIISSSNFASDMPVIVIVDVNVEVSLGNARHLVTVP